MSSPRNKICCAAQRTLLRTKATGASSQSAFGNETSPLRRVDPARQPHSAPRSRETCIRVPGTSNLGGARPCLGWIPGLAGALAMTAWAASTGVESGSLHGRGETVAAGAERSRLCRGCLRRETESRDLDRARLTLLLRNDLGSLAAVVAEYRHDNQRAVCWNLRCPLQRVRGRDPGRLRPRHSPSRNPRSASGGR